MQVNILRKIINRTMTGWFKSTYFLEMFFNHMSDTSQHTLENQQQDNGWVIQVNILSWKVFQAYHMGDVNSTYFRNSIKGQWVGDSSNHTFLRWLSTISEENHQTPKNQNFGRVFFLLRLLWPNFFFKFYFTLTANNSPLKCRTPKNYHIFGNLWTSAFSWCPLDMV